MNILYTITSYPPAVGGAQLHTHQVVRELARGDNVQVITQWTKHRTDWLLGTTLNAPRRTESYEIDGVAVQTITLTQRERWQLAPYVLSYYGWKRGAVGRISDVLALKIDAFASDVEIIHNARIGREGISYASLKVARQRGVPFVFVPYHHPRWVGWNYKEYIALYQQADALIALTNVEKETLVGLGVQPERIYITGMGPVVMPDANGAERRRSYNLGDAPVILFLAQKYRYKGVSALLEAANLVWSRFPDARFVFVGPPTRYSRRLFAPLDEPRIIELGSVSLQEKSEWLAACTLLCVPSHQESFGGVYTEAWMMGKPVIGGDIPAIREVIAEGEDGYVVSQHPASIAEKICYLLDHPALAAQMGARGRQKVLECYTWDKLARKTKEVYESVLS
ncbi:MAG TPA: glycosyltransferase family 4 protein [Ardenticatenaceae bacterium]